MNISQEFQQALQHHRAGRLQQAEAIYREILAVHPNQPDALHLLGVIAHQLGRDDLAADLIGKAISLAPHRADYHCNLGDVLRRRGQLDQAIAAYRVAVQINRNLVEAHNRLGNIFKQRGQFDQAVAAYREVAELNPGDAGAFNNLGVALTDQGELDQAIVAYRTAIRLQTGLAEAHNNLGNALENQGKLDQALAAYQTAIELKPNFAEAHYNLGDAYKDQGRLDEALTSYRRSIELKPEFITAHSSIAYAIHFHPDYDPAAILQENRRWATKFELPLRGEIRPHENDRNSDRRLKIGYVSPDFRKHAAACFLLPLLSNHDPENVEIYCYASVKRPDAVTARMQRLPLHWRDSLAMSDAELAQAIRQDGIDILVDLTLHMADNRLLVFARKPAPVQVTWLGYPSTTGLSSIDYRLTDPYLDSPGSGDEFYVERSIRLPHTFWCYQPLAEDTPPVNPSPAQTNGFVTFGCFNNFAKVTAVAIRTWMQILKSVSESRLLLQSHSGSHRQHVVQLFEDAGIAAERVEFVPFTSPEEYFRYYLRVDLCLDPMPCPGHTSNLDALWMGVPTVTLSGQTAVSRGGQSILSNAGLPEFIAHSGDEYISIAVGAAGDLDRLHELRPFLRAKLQASPLMDGRQFAADIESAYRQMWRNWSATHP